MTRDVKMDVFYPQAPERVWRALTDSKLLAEWLMPNDFAPREGHEFTFRLPPKPGFDGIIHCKVTEAVAPSRLVYTWSGGWGSSHTTVAWTLVPEGSGTRLHLSHSGFQGVLGFVLSLMMGSGWRTKLTRVIPKLIDGPGLAPVAA